ncbi:3-phosphoshikimate 1-carboxyvinyltransferase [Sesbania bispinosa]|nr:3-phosphoshikimate 1-carboxyvinyltransferase [Sesbania bispinosa]
MALSPIRVVVVEAINVNILKKLHALAVKQKAVMIDGKRLIFIEPIISLIFKSSSLTQCYGASELKCKGSS